MTEQKPICAWCKVELDLLVSNAAGDKIMGCPQCNYVQTVKIGGKDET